MYSSDLVALHTAAHTRSIHVCNCHTLPDTRLTPWPAVTTTDTTAKYAEIAPGITGLAGSSWAWSSSAQSSSSSSSRKFTQAFYRSIAVSLTLNQMHHRPPSQKARLPTLPRHRLDSRSHTSRPRPSNLQLWRPATRAIRAEPESISSAADSTAVLQQQQQPTAFVL